MKLKDIKVGSKVFWLCKPYKQAPFECEGRVIEMWESVFGSKVRKMGARMFVITNKYEKRYRKRIAFVAIDKLWVKKKVGRGVF